MSKLQFLAALLLVLAAMAPAGEVESAGSCGLSAPAFCDTFDAPASTGNRSGQLNGVVWGVSRLTGAMNMSGVYDDWAPTRLDGCGSSTTVLPDNDVIICNGQLREASNDQGTVTQLAMYPKQPFDFAGRTGVVTFDVTNDTGGTHAFWPEFWITSKPVPAPDTSQVQSTPQDGFGISFGANAPPGQAGYCPTLNNIDQPRWMIDRIDVVRNYQVQRYGDDALTRFDCPIASSGPNGGLNHVEVHVSQNQIDVYASDAGTTLPLRHVATLSNANLSFTRGLVWIVDSHYNAEKAGADPQHTFTWDNVGFDGPALPRDLAYDVPDALQSVGDGTVNLGWQEGPGQLTQKQVTGVVSPSAAAGALLTSNLYTYGVPMNLVYSVNGHQHSMGWPFPNTDGFYPRTIAIPLDLSEVQAGTNTLALGGSDQAMIVFNMDLIMVGAGGGGSPLPTSVATSTLTPTLVATSTPTATATSPVSTPTSTPTSTPPVPSPTATVAPTSGVLTCTLTILPDGTAAGKCQPG